MCEWCGHEHARDALCTSRPKWSRRGFLSLFGAGIAGLAVAPSLTSQAKAVSAVSALWDAGVFKPTTAMLDAILKEIYQPVIEAQLKNSTEIHRLMRVTKGKTFRVHAR